jgi:hypothetical protein
MTIQPSVEPTGELEPTNAMDLNAIKPNPTEVTFLYRYVKSIDTKWKAGVTAGDALQYTYISIKALTEAKKYRNGVQHYFTLKENEAKKVFAEARLASQEGTDPKKEADAKRNPRYNELLVELAEVTHALENLNAAVAQAEFFHYMFRDIYRTEAKVPIMPDMKQF